MNPRTVLKHSARAVDVLRPPPRGTVVLLYHRVGRRSAVEVDLPVDLFARQCEAVAGRGGTVSLAAALAALEADDGAAPPVVITFDDGTADVVELAVPVLEQHGLTATLYLATAFVDEQRWFPDGGRPATWQLLADALGTGHLEIGSHTHRHALLDRLAPERIDDELDRSIGLIEDHLGVTPHHFAYPKAVLGSPQAQAAVRRRFRSAALAGTRANRPGATDPYRLARSPVQHSDGMRWFEHKLAGGMHAEDRIRQVLNRRRYRDATT